MKISNKIKRCLLLILLVGLCCFLLCACGAKTPGDKMIKQDLEASLAESRSALTLTEWKTDKCITENKTYSASAAVTAESDYAIYHLTAEMKYTRYDQGWQMDSCQWLPGDIEIKIEPTTDQIAEDLQAPLSDYKEFLAVNNCSVNDSTTEGNTYAANLIVSALSKYAEYDLTADAKYILNDEGWTLDNCVLTENGYQIASYPDAETMTRLVNENDALVQDELDGQTCSKLKTESTTIIYEGAISKEINSHVTKVGTVTSDWEYNSFTDGWDFLNKEDEIRYELSGIEGEWISGAAKAQGLEGSITVSNYTGTGFDVSCKTYNTNTVHVEYTGMQGKNYLVYEGDGINYSFHSGWVNYGGEDCHVKVYLQIQDSGLTAVLTIGNVGDWAAIE